MAQNETTGNRGMLLGVSRATQFFYMTGCALFFIGSFFVCWKDMNTFCLIFVRQDRES